MSSMVGVLKTGTAYPSRSPGFTPAFDGIRVAHRFSFLCCVVCLRPVLCCLSSSCVLCWLSSSCVVLFVFVLCCVVCLRPVLCFLSSSCVVLFVFVLCLVSSSCVLCFQYIFRSFGLSRREVLLTMLTSPIIEY
jgi:hypothetical protein